MIHREAQEMSADLSDLLFLVNYFAAVSLLIISSFSVYLQNNYKQLYFRIIQVMLKKYDNKVKLQYFIIYITASKPYTSVQIGHPVILI